MSSSFEKSVKGATKIKNAPPKTKYIEHIIIATHSDEAGVAEVFRALQYRMRDSTWTVVFKSLITVHMMIREGKPDETLSFLARHKNMLAISSFSDAQTQGRNIRHYANYLSERARAYRDTNTDWVRVSSSKLEKLSVDKGLLRETEVVQRQLTALLKCDVLDTEPENEITITVFRLLVLDLLALFQVMNQALINILGHFFEMSKTDAERAMEVYRNFTKLTDFVVAYLSVARQHEHHTRVEVPKIKHAPTNLGRQLEDYLKDPDFEVHRRQYIAEQEAKRKGGRAASKSPRLELKSPQSATKGSNFPMPAPASNNPFPAVKSTPGPTASTQSTATNPPPGDLIDFFDSIEQNQTPMQVNSPPQAPQQQVSQQPGLVMEQNQSPMQLSSPPQVNQLQAPQQTGFISNGFQQQQSGFSQPPSQAPQIFSTGFPQQQPQGMQQQNFGGYTPQPNFQPGSLGAIPQDSMASFQSQPLQQFPAQQQQTGYLQPMATGTTNPFRQSMLMNQQSGMSANSSVPTSPQSGQAPNLLQRQSTNPFARNALAPSSIFPSQQPSPPAPLQPTPTGTNPFARTSPHQDQRPQTAGAALLPQPTGSTNPFRQGAFVNHTTGMGWQANQTPIGGGLDQLPTVPVFPRPAQQTPWQQ